MEIPPMALGVLNKIADADIKFATRMKLLKVVLLTGHQKQPVDTVVVKTDSYSAGHLKAANTIMKTVDPSARVKALDPTEVAALGQFVARRRALLQQTTGSHRVRNVQGDT